MTFKISIFIFYIANGIENYGHLILNDLKPLRPGSYNSSFNVDLFNGSQFDGKKSTNNKVQFLLFLFFFLIIVLGFLIFIYDWQPIRSHYQRMCFIKKSISKTMKNSKTNNLS